MVFFPVRPQNFIPLRRWILARKQTLQNLENPTFTVGEYEIAFKEHEILAGFPFLEHDHNHKVVKELAGYVTWQRNLFSSSEQSKVVKIDSHHKSVLKGRWDQ